MASNSEHPAGLRLWGPPVLLLVLGLAVTVPLLGASGLWDPWEAPWT